MSLQEMPCFEGALFYKGCFKLMQDAQLIQLFIESLEEYFINPESNWNQINKIFGIYGFSPTISQGSPSKDVEAGDGSKVPWSSPSGVVGCMVTIFNTFENLGLLINPELLRITYTIQPDSEERKRLQIWKSLFGQYATIKETETSMIVLSYTIASQHNSNSKLIYSPAQIAMYSNSLISTSIKEPGPYGSSEYSVLSKVPWDTSNTILSQASSMLASPWETSLHNITLVEPIYEQRIANHLITAGNKSAEEGSAPPVNFSGGNLLFCIEKILKVSSLIIDDPDYVPEDPPLDPPSEPDELLVPVASCFSEFGERPEETSTYDILDSSTHNCGKHSGLVEIEDPENPGETIEVVALINSCPYKSSCQNPGFLNPILITFDNGSLSLDESTYPEDISNSVSNVNDYLKIYYRIVHT